MFAFCVHGVDVNKDWKAINEELKDELYFYFNSKYARREYRTERGEQFSLLVDTDEGKRSSWETVLKFMQVVDNQWISKNSEAGSTQNDNAGENGAFPPTRDGCIHSLSMRKRG